MSELVADRFPDREPRIDMELLARGQAELPRVLEIMGYTGLRQGQDGVIHMILAGRDVLCVLPTSTGKTACFVIPALCHDWNVLVFSPLQALMRDQVQNLSRLWKDKMHLFPSMYKGPPVNYMSGQKTELENNMAAQQWARGELNLLYIAPERLGNENFQRALEATPPDMIVLDECFAPEVEILTEDGFVRFDELEEGIKVAEVDPDTQRMEFVLPEKIIRKPFKGNLTRLHSKQLCDLTMTPGHELLAYYGDGRWKKEPVERIAMNHVKRFLAAVPVVGREDRLLSDVERLAVAYQADGNEHRREADGSVTAAFSFVKERKIVRFLRLVESCGYPYNEVKDSHPLRRRFIVRGVPGLSKRLSDMFVLSNMSAAFAADFVKEASQWDGSELYDGQLYYSSTIRENSEFVQAVAVLAGFKTNLMVQKDGRSDSFSDVWRLFISTERNWIGAQRLKRETVPYDGYVHCVRVSAGNIVVRGGGKTMVIGNCHCLSEWGHNFRSDYRKVGDLVQAIQPKVVAAFTATCTPPVERDVRHVLGIQKAQRELWWPRRKNLLLQSADYVDDFHLAGLIRENQAEMGGAQLVYCGTQKGTEEMAEFLSEQLKDSHGRKQEVGAFHGDMTNSQKRLWQDRFMSNDIRVMACTNAFGMGVDKPDIRGVYHRQFPGSPEALIQEVGRAGRDGNDSVCMSLHDPKTMSLQRFFIQTGYPVEKDIRALFHTMQARADAEGILQLTGYEMGQLSGINHRHVEAILEILKGDLVIERAKVEEKICKVKVTGEKPDIRFQEVLGILPQIGVQDSAGAWEFDLLELPRQVGKTDETIRKWFRDWDKEGFIEFTPPFRGATTRIIGSPDVIDFERLRYKCQQAYDRLSVVETYLTIPDPEKHDYIEEYFFKSVDE